MNESIDGMNESMNESMNDNMSRPTRQELLKKWVEWAFVPSKRRYCDHSMVLKHEVERLWPDYHVREAEFTKAMVEAGFPATKERYYHFFRVKDSLSRKTYFRERRWYYDVSHPLLRLDPTTEFERLPDAERQRLLEWIGEHVHRPMNRQSIDSIYMCELATRNSSTSIVAFCGALLAAGYQPVNPTSYRWRFSREIHLVSMAALIV